MTIHPKLEKFHVKGNSQCKKQKGLCDNFWGCGKETCLKVKKQAKVPCEWCVVWTGEGFKDWEIENMVTMFEVMSNRRHP